MHGPLIEKSSYIEGDFSVPTTVEELAVLLPGNSQYDDIDDLLIKLGNQHDRALLHSFASKLFKVPQKLLVNAEKNKASLVPKSVLDAVYERRRKAKDAAAAINSAQSLAPTIPTADIRGEDSGSDWPKPEIIGIDESIEYADHDYLCTECLPVYGDEIIGIVPTDDTFEATPKVCRVCCPIAQRAINRDLAESQKASSNSVFPFQVDSESLRQDVSGSVQDLDNVGKPVKLQWPTYPGATDEKDYFFPCEIVVHCQDRKLLLADCSETVSELSEIIKTGSLTTNEHATLVFLVKIRCLDDLQKMMNSLRLIPSVMAVERRVS